MEKIYRVQMNSNGMPNFSTAVEIDTDISEYSDKLWRNAYERGKEEEHRWWSEHCAKCTDADRPQGWIPLNTELPTNAFDIIGFHRGEFASDTFMVVTKGVGDEFHR